MIGAGLFASGARVKKRSGGPAGVLVDAVDEGFGIVNIGSYNINDMKNPVVSWH